MPFPKHCSFAHYEEDRRDHTFAFGDYEQTEVIRRPLPTLGGTVLSHLNLQADHASSLIGTISNLPAYCAEGTRVPGSFFHTEEFLPIDEGSEHWFMVQYEAFFAFLQEKALGDGLSRITRSECFQKYQGKSGLLIVGPSADTLLSKIAALLLKPPKRFFVSEQKAYSVRVAAKLIEDGSTRLLGQLSDSAFLKISEEDVKVCAKNGKGYRGNEILKLVFEKIDFWVKKVGYDRFLCCSVCCEDRNKDEGIVCPKGHFYCSTEGCIDRMVESQKHSLHAQQTNIVCSVCQTTLEMRELAKHLTRQTWKELFSAVLDAKVKDTEETLAKQFYQRLQARIEEFMDQYESVDEGESRDSCSTSA